MSDTFNHELDALESLLNDGGILPQELDNPQLMSSEDYNSVDMLRRMCSLTSEGFNPIREVATKSPRLRKGLKYNGYLELEEKLSESEREEFFRRVPLRKKYNFPSQAKFPKSEVDKIHPYFKEYLSKRVTNFERKFVCTSCGLIFKVYEMCGCGLHGKWKALKDD